MAEDFVAAFASGRTGKVGAGAGEWDTELGDQVVDDFVFWPTKSNATGVGRDLQWEAVGGVNNDGERAWPASLGEAIKIIGEIFGKDLSIDERVDQDGEGLVLGTSFDAKNFLDSRKIDGISSESVESVGGHSDYRTTV